MPKLKKKTRKQLEKPIRKLLKKYDGATAAALVTELITRVAAEQPASAARTIVAPAALATNGMPDTARAKPNVTKRELRGAAKGVGGSKKPPTAS